MIDRIRAAHPPTAPPYFKERMNELWDGLKITETRLLTAGGKKFRESDMSPEKFSKHMKETMKKYGWSEKDIKKMVARAVGKDVE